MSEAKYSRILLKISGEALRGDNGFGIDANVVEYLAKELQTVLFHDVQVGLIIGAGNFFRGASLLLAGVERATGDQMGMVATVINALAMKDIFAKFDIDSRIMSAFQIGSIADIYHRDRAINELNLGKVLLLVGGTGNPYLTTDSALSLRGIELKANLLIKATNVDGVFSADPKKNPEAIFYSKLTYQEALSKELAVMDLTSIIQCRDHNMTLRVCNIHKPGALERVVLGEEEGTLVTN